MDEKLRATIEKIKILAVQDSDFRSEMQKLFGGKRNTPDNFESSKVDNIEHYLGLDYKVDNQDSTIDYSFIEDEECRKVLIADNREMMRYRYGTRYHEVKFDEFCRYMVLQVEMLLNNHYGMRFCSIEEIVKNIKTYNERVKFNDMPKSVQAIPLSVKLWAFSNEYNIDRSTKENIEFAIKVRNNLSHRSDNKENEERDLIFIAKMDNALKPFPRHKSGLVNFASLKDNMILFNVYNTTIKSEDYNNYKYILWKRTKPYDDVVHSLNLFRDYIYYNLKQPE